MNAAYVIFYLMLSLRPRGCSQNRNILKVNCDQNSSNFFEFLLRNGYSCQIRETRKLLGEFGEASHIFLKNGLWRMSASLASPSKTGWQMSASLASPSNTAWRMSASLASPRKTACECQQVWRVQAKQVGKCWRVWRVRATRLGKCRRVRRGSHISENDRFGECEYSPEMQIFAKYSHSQNLRASSNCSVFMKKLQKSEQNLQKLCLKFIFLNISLLINFTIQLFD
jgi:hypothetical protein